MKFVAYILSFLIIFSLTFGGELKVKSNYPLPHNNLQEVYDETKDKELILKLLNRTGDIESAYFEDDTLVIHRKLYVRHIYVKGNWSFWRSEILAATGISEGSAVDEDNLKILKERLKRFYVDKGYPYVKINTSYKKTSDGFVDIWIYIDRGKQYKISKVILDYKDRKPSKYLEKFLLKKMNIKGKTFSVITIQEGLDRGEDYLHSLGFFDAILSLEGYEPEKKKGVSLGLFFKEPMKVKISVSLGNKYIIVIDGVKGRLRRDILSILTLKSDGISRYTLEKNAKLIREFLIERGYLDAKVRFSSRLIPKGDKFIITYHVDLGNRYIIDDIDIFTDDEKLRKYLLSFRGKPAEIGKIKDFLEKLTTELMEDGYWNVKKEFTYYKLDKNKIKVTVHFFKGKRMLIKNVFVLNCKSFLKEKDLEPPKVFDPDWIEKTRQEIKDFLIRKGYLDADVEVRLRSEELEDKIYYTVIFKAINKIPYKRKTVFIYGTEHLFPTAVKRSLFRDAGEKFSFEDLENNMNYLYKTFLFTEVRGFVEKVEDKKEVAESYVLKEDKRGLLQTSISFNSEEEYRFSSLLVLKNIMNYGFETSGYINISQRNVLSRLSLGSRILPYKTSFFTNFYKDRQYHKIYDVDVEGYGIDLSRYPNKWVVHSLKLERNYVQLKNLPLNYTPILEDYFVVKLNYHIFDDHRDNKMDPMHGYIFEGNVYKFFEDFNFIKANAQFRYYTSYKSYVTFTQRLSGGYIWESLEDIPISERFFLGGIGNFRGFSFEQLGGTHGLGGKSFLLLNNDVRFPIYRPLKGFFFIDVGNVYESDSEIRNLETRETGGIGLYLPTPAGSIIVDYARKLDKRKGESPARFEFQISILF